MKQPENDTFAQGSSEIKPLSRADRWFQVDDLKHGLGQRTARGGAYTLGTTAINLVVTTICTVLVTRNLTDEDFGLYGMVIVITGFASMFVDLGLSRAVVQKPQINHNQVSTLFWINLGAATLLAIVVAAATPLIVWFFNEPRLVPINIAISGLFVVSALALQHRALLERRMEFGRLNLVALVAPLIASAVAVVLALMDLGYWALVAIPAVGQMLTTIGMWSMCRWVPGRPRRKTGVRQMLAFGGHVTGFQFINYFSRNADNVILGYVWGASSLGLYARAFSLMMLPVTKVLAPLNPLVIPALARAVDDPFAYRHRYRRALGLVTTASTIPTTALLLIGPEMVPLLLGPNWHQIVPLYLILGPAILTVCSNSASAWLYLSYGHVKRQTLASLFSMAFTVLCLIVGVWYGALGVAFAVSFSRVLSKVPYVAYSCRGTPVCLRDYFGAVGWPTLTALAPGVAVFLTAHLFVKPAFVSTGDMPSALWEASVLNSGPALLMITFKLVAWTLLIGVTTLIFKGARQAIIYEPVSALRSLRSA
ncbi:MAG: lipopolysaccharide biosynthesis protein [Planctomycetota bacterium]